MFENYYQEGSIEIIKDNFEIYMSNEIRKFLCMSKFYGIAVNTISIFDLTTSYSDEPLYKDQPNVTYKDLQEFISDEEFIDIYTSDTFVKLYEKFEFTLYEFIKYIHYKKPQIILNKDRTISCDELNDIRTKEELIEDLIEKRCKEIMYSNNVTSILKFIEKYSKNKIEETDKEIIMSLSRIRNNLVHNNGYLKKEELHKVSSAIEINDEIMNVATEYGVIRIALDEEVIGRSMQLYFRVIEEVCEGMKKIFEGECDTTKQTTCEVVTM